MGQVINNIWNPLSDEVTKELINTVNEFYEKKKNNFSQSIDIKQITCQELSFYRNTKVINIEYKQKDPELFFWIDSEELKPITFNNAAFYKLNERNDFLTLENDNNYKDYIRTFFTYVKGRHGHFMVVEKVDDMLELLKDEDREKFKEKMYVVDAESYQHDEPSKWSTNGEARLKATLTPIEKSNEVGTTKTFKSFMFFKDSLFYANVHVETNGLISLSDEKLVLEGIPYIMEYRYNFKKELEDSDHDKIKKCLTDNMTFFNFEIANVHVEKKTNEFTNDNKGEGFYRIYDYSLKYTKNGNGLLYHVMIKLKGEGLNQERIVRIMEDAEEEWKDQILLNYGNTRHFLPLELKYNKSYSGELLNTQELKYKQFNNENNYCKFACPDIYSNQQVYKIDLKKKEITRDDTSQEVSSGNNHKITKKIEEILLDF